MNRRGRFVVALIIALLFVSYAPVRAQTQGPVYIVQPGDNLTAIAVMFGTTVEALVAANNIEDPSILIPGTRLIIPGYDDVEGVLVIREIVFGENLSSLGIRYGTSAEDLARINRVVSPGRVYVGQPMILAEREDISQTLSNSSLLIPDDGESKFELAVRTGVNPWSLFPFTGNDLRTWVVPGSPVVLPGGDRPVNAFPEPIRGVEIDPLPSGQGQTTRFLVDLIRPAEVEGQFGEWGLNFFPLESETLVALQGVHALNDPGLYELEISLDVSPQSDLVYTFSQPVKVLEWGYGFETINGVPSETIDLAIIDPEQEMVEALLSPATPERFWEGPFHFPTDYYTERFLSVFGTRRSYNRGAYYYYHTGLDFYGGTGVEILAPAPGRVVFAGSLVMRGSVTYIDHGWGVYSGYFHQSEILVSEGDTVVPGQVIGIVGGTGRSTGPHLHWEIWVGGVPVDPLKWVQVGFP
ncbi:MAG: peptidoglycan DD-metalloendopeptidase family protein [Anaerolineales bacterium]|nr:peptidoglycan DD-metalloendopeptidase family protein [Anaerolineales bacterium]